ncbi:class I adenylate cyclase [Spirabiliibacterium falconis]|uniref:class I adenylate cyclase n=1 Tax=Spirabiliibacterium falconis TaxID=572023 RepID=UPI001AAC50BE|nr:class I adenylate cyclase [Spirabiliibacterium falconis]MBE2894476.1 class I adenylate cyclase [Spirabiliibacterium falconis]
MSSYLESAKELVSELDQRRFQRAIDGNSQEFCHVFQLITLLLDVNHPALPGYVHDAPAGIAGFLLSDYQRHYLYTIVPNSVYPNDFLTASKRKKTPILGVYAMGSTGSITQNSQSDLDIWVCISEQISTTAYTRLSQKTALLQKWAQTMKVEMNFYLLHENHFRNTTYSTVLSTENCGSSQYVLLLDEFYRSVIRLAGKPLLWLHMPINNEEYYDKAVEKWIAESKIVREEWVDFGGLGALSADEYFGATLWHLYKGVDSPYKSVIKILLLEALMAEYPYPALISKQFKQQLLSGAKIDHYFDPYLAMLQKVSAYLRSINDKYRLELVRRCFYIKANRDNDDLSQQKSWRYQQLQHFAQQWHWSAKDVEMLNNHGRWKIKQVNRFYHSLVAVFMQSYRNLITFARKQKISADLMPEDIGILTRKLYTAFEVLPGKVTLFNRQIVDNMTEDHLMFVEVRHSSAVKEGWYLFNTAPNKIIDSRDRYVEYAPHLGKLVAWAYFNGLLGAKTRLHIRSPNVSLAKLQQFVTDLRLSITQSALPPSNDDFSHPCELRHLFVAVNLTHDPTEHIVGNDRRSVQSNDLFNFGPEQTCLLGSMSLIYRNRWNEIRTLHFEGQHAILNCLKVLAHKVHCSASPLESVQVCCYSKRYRDEMLATAAKLVHKCIRAQVSMVLNKRSINRLQVAGKMWNFSYETRGLRIQEDGVGTLPDNSMQAARNISQNKYHFPMAIGEFASEGFLQFFFEDNRDGSFNVYILDEQNNPEIYYRCKDEKEEKIKEINRLYTMDRYNSATQNANYSFNYPQFYQLILDQAGNEKIVPFRSQQHLRFQGSEKIAPLYV